MRSSKKNDECEIHIVNVKQKTWWSYDYDHMQGRKASSGSVQQRYLPMFSDLYRNL